MFGQNPDRAMYEPKRTSRTPGIRGWHVALALLVAFLASTPYWLPFVELPNGWSEPLSLRAGHWFHPRRLELLLPVAALVISFGGLVWALYERESVGRHVTRVLLLPLLALAAVELGTLVGAPLRRDGLDSIVRNLSTLPAAIEEWRAAHGSYPDSLPQLVPSALATLPTTGAPGYPRVVYTKHTGEVGRGRHAEGYSLVVDTSIGRSFLALLYDSSPWFSARMYREQLRYRPDGWWDFWYAPRAYWRRRAYDADAGATPRRSASAPAERSRPAARPSPP